MLCNFLPGNLDQFWHLEGTILFVSFQVVMELERFQLEFAKDKKWVQGSTDTDIMTYVSHEERILFIILLKLLNSLLK